MFGVQGSIAGVALRAVGALGVALVTSCQALVTFDPVGASSDDGGRTDGDADAVGDGQDAPDDVGEGVDETSDSDAGTCGNGRLDPGEECDGALPASCITVCGSGGTRRCVGCRWSATCDPPVESCSGIDDDCDTEIDEGFGCAAGSAVECLTTCGSLGRGTCTAGCSVPGPGACPIGPETCNGQDDDCDGDTDEGFPCAAGSRVPCVADCGTAGYRLCRGDCTVPTDVPCTPPVETCNAVDDDCDTVCDDDFLCCSGRPGECVTSCGSVGTGVCAADCLSWSGPGCVPPEETCNGVDDDCDTECDEGDACCAGEIVSCMTTCGTPGVGPCSASCSPPAPEECAAPGGEVCDGLDNDCDGMVDEDIVALLGPEVRVTASAGRSDGATVAWTGLEYGIAWRDEREPGNSEIYFVRLDDTGGKIGDDLRVTNAPAYSGQAKLVWTGTEYAIAWRDDRHGNPEIFFTRIAADGTPLGTETRVTETAGPSASPAPAWTGIEYVVVWREEVAAVPWIGLSRLDDAGVERPGAEMLIERAPDMSAGSGPAIAAAADGFLVAWDDRRYGNPEVIVARRAADGSERTPPARVTNDPAASLAPVLASTGAGFAVAWRDFRDGNYEIYFAILDDAGNRVGTEIRLTDDPAGTPALSLAPALAWTGGEFGLAWQDRRSGDYDVYFARIDASGRKIGGDLQIADLPGEAGEPALVLAGDRWGFAWHDDRDRDYEIYFALAGCP